MDLRRRPAAGAKQFECKLNIFFTQNHPISGALNPKTDLGPVRGQLLEMWGGCAGSRLDRVVDLRARCRKLVIQSNFKSRLPENLVTSAALHFLDKCYLFFKAVIQSAASAACLEGSWKS